MALHYWEVLSDKCRIWKKFQGKILIDIVVDVKMNKKKIFSLQQGNQSERSCDVDSAAWERAPVLCWHRPGSHLPLHLQRFYTWQQNS